MGIYLDNASTSFPKPSAVLIAVEHAVRDIGVNPGRGGYKAAQIADNLIFEARMRVAGFFCVNNPARVIFTPGGTYSINMALGGILSNGDHVIVAGRQHNAVVRTLALYGDSISYSRFPWNGGGAPEPAAFSKYVTSSTRAIILNHGSNVDGLLFPIEDFRKAALEFGLILIVDAAQTAGLVKISTDSVENEVLCIAGHKGLLGIAGAGLLIVGNGVNLKPVIAGGTGSYSDDTEMPRSFPDRFEPGSMNLAGIAALNAGIKEVQEKGVDEIFRKKMHLSLYAFEELKRLKGITAYWPQFQSNRLPLFSFRITGHDPSDVAFILSERFGIFCRVGLHCSPDSHKEIGTYPEGTIRFAPGIQTSETEIEIFIKAIAEIVGLK